MSPAIQRQYDAARAAGTLARPIIDATLGDRTHGDKVYACKCGLMTDSAEVWRGHMSGADHTIHLPVCSGMHTIQRS